MHVARFGPDLQQRPSRQRAVGDRPGLQLLQQHGSSGSDVAALPKGTFYVATEGMALEKIQTSLCLSHHPSSPPDEGEIQRMAAASRTLVR